MTNPTGDRTCPLGEDCDLTVAWMAGAEDQRKHMHRRLAEAAERIEALETENAMLRACKGQDGGRAFPACNEANVNGTMGMSLRDWFAGQALAGIMASGLPNDVESPELSRAAYLVADAMLAARSNGKG